MKQYVTHGTGSAQTLSEVQNTNVVVYDTKADAEADLSNLAEGQIVATKDSGDELAQPVDITASGNMHAVTSNAVYNAIGQWETTLNLGDYGGSNYIQGISTKNGKYLRLRLVGLSSGSFYNGQLLFTLPEGWRPAINPVRAIVAVDTNVDRITAGLDIYTNGEVKVFFHGHTPIAGQTVDGVTGFYSDAIIPLF